LTLPPSIHHSHITLTTPGRHAPESGAAFSRNHRPTSAEYALQDLDTRRHRLQAVIFLLELPQALASMTCCASRQSGQNG
jgi:hypothetical protein